MMMIEGLWGMGKLETTSDLSVLTSIRFCSWASSPPESWCCMWKWWQWVSYRCTFGIKKSPKSFDEMNLKKGWTKAMGLCIWWHVAVRCSGVIFSSPMFIGVELSNVHTWYLPTLWKTFPWIQPGCIAAGKGAWYMYWIRKPLDISCPQHPQTTQASEPGRPGSSCFSSQGAPFLSKFSAGACPQTLLVGDACGTLGLLLNIFHCPWISGKIEWRGVSERQFGPVKEHSMRLDKQHDARDLAPLTSGTAQQS